MEVPEPCLQPFQIVLSLRLAAYPKPCKVSDMSGLSSSLVQLLTKSGVGCVPRNFCTESAGRLLLFAGTDAHLRASSLPRSL
jgi:hypothetical protein